MKQDNTARIVKELVRFVKEQRKINHRLEYFVREQHSMNVQSEHRFRTFYRMIVNLQKHAG